MSCTGCNLCWTYWYFSYRYVFFVVVAACC